MFLILQINIGLLHMLHLIASSLFQEIEIHDTHEICFFNMSSSENILLFFAGLQPQGQ